jgi:Lipase (class 3)
MNPAVMLTLVALTYRGCEFNLANAHSRKIVYDEVARCLRNYGPEPGKWTMVWGPAGYRPTTANPDNMDISEMYAVSDGHSNLAIVLRGTNLFSALDWTSNLLIDEKSWEYGGAGPEVKISHSTALHLHILQHLQSGPVPAPNATESDAERLQAAKTAKQAADGYALIKGVLQGHTEFHIEGLLPKIDQRIADAKNRGELPENQASLAHPFADVEQPPVPEGTLLEFLKGFVAKAPTPLNIYVIGHSKSGAVAPALALWLADTQGKTVPASEQWDPANKATLHLYTFAGPTPGNAQFATRFQQKITDAQRFANPNDVVPHVWEPGEVKEIPDLYGDGLWFLRPAADALALFLREPAYTHEAPPAPWKNLTETPLNTMQRIAFEHLDAYLQEFGIYDANTLSLLALFAPIPTSSPSGH